MKRKVLMLATCVVMSGNVCGYGAFERAIGGYSPAQVGVGAGVLGALATLLVKNKELRIRWNVWRDAVAAYDKAFQGGSNELEALKKSKSEAFASFLRTLGKAGGMGVVLGLLSGGAQYGRDRQFSKVLDQIVEEDRSASASLSTSPRAPHGQPPREYSDGIEAVRRGIAEYPRVARLVKAHPGYVTESFLGCDVVGFAPQEEGSRDENVVIQDEHGRQVMSCKKEDVLPQVGEAGPFSSDLSFLGRYTAVAFLPNEKDRVLAFQELKGQRIEALVEQIRKSNQDIYKEQRGEALIREPSFAYSNAVLMAELLAMDKKKAITIKSSVKDDLKNDLIDSIVGSDGEYNFPQSKVLAERAGLSREFNDEVQKAKEDSLNLTKWDEEAATEYWKEQYATKQMETFAREKEVRPLDVETFAGKLLSFIDSNSASSIFEHKVLAWMDVMEGKHKEAVELLDGEVSQLRKEGKNEEASEKLKGLTALEGRAKDYLDLFQIIRSRLNQPAPVAA